MGYLRFKNKCVPDALDPVKVAMKDLRACLVVEVEAVEGCHRSGDEANCLKTTEATTTGTEDREKRETVGVLTQFEIRQREREELAVEGDAERLLRAVRNAFISLRADVNRADHICDVLDSEGYLAMFPLLAVFEESCPWCSGTGWFLGKRCECQTGGAE